LLWQENLCLLFQAICYLGALWLGLGQVLHFQLSWGGYATSNPKSDIILSTTPIAYRGEGILHLSCLVFEIPFWAAFGLFGFFQSKM